MKNSQLSAVFKKLALAVLVTALSPVTAQAATKPAAKRPASTVPTQLPRHNVNYKYTLATPALTIEKRGTVLKVPAKPAAHAIGLVTTFDVETPDENGSYGVEGRGKFAFKESKIARAVSYSSRVALNQSQQSGGLQMGLAPAFLPKAFGLQGRVQVAHKSENLKMQYDFGPALTLLDRNVAGVGITMQAFERIHLEKGLLEHELTLGLKKNGFGFFALGGLATPAFEAGGATAKFYAEVSKNFAHDRFQAVIGGATAGKSADWKANTQVLTGLRVLI